MILFFNLSVVCAKITMGQKKYPIWLGLRLIPYLKKDFVTTPQPMFELCIPSLPSYTASPLFQRFAFAFIIQIFYIFVIEHTWDSVFAYICSRSTDNMIFKAQAKIFFQDKFQIAMSLSISSSLFGFLKHVFVCFLHRDKAGSRVWQCKWAAHCWIVF